MGRRPAYAPLRVYLNNRRVGTLSREASGAIGFAYHEDWLGWEHALPVSLSLPLRETPYRGEPVAAVFENLLPDSDRLRRMVAENVGARGTDAYSMLTKIGHDCVGALQFIAGDDDDAPDATGKLDGETVDEAAIEKILKGLSLAPLGLTSDDASGFLSRAHSKRRRCSGMMDNGSGHTARHRPRISSRRRLANCLAASISRTASRTNITA